MQTVHTSVVWVSVSWLKAGGSGTLNDLPGLTVGEGRTSISETEAAPLSDEKLGVFLGEEQLCKADGQITCFSYSAVVPDVLGNGTDGMCTGGEGAVMGCLGGVVYFEVCGKSGISFSCRPRLIFHKHSPHKQHVFSQPLLSFPEPLAGFQKPIIIIIIKNLRTEPFVPKIHLYLELFAEETRARDVVSQLWNLSVGPPTPFNFFSSI